MNVQELLTILGQYSSSDEVLISDNNIIINDGYLTGNHYSIIGSDFRRVANGLDIPPSDPEFEGATSYVVIISSGILKK